MNLIPVSFPLYLLLSLSIFNKRLLDGGTSLGSEFPNKAKWFLYRWGLNPHLIIPLLPLSLLPCLFFNSGQALAIPARTVYAQDAQGIQSNGVELKVWRGYGVSINFIPTGETIKQVWIGDPSRIGFTSNGDLCQKNDSNTECANTGATVLFLRQIKPVNFPNMTNSADGSTQITVITNGSDGQKQYQFKITPATGQPSYTSLVIKPDSSRPAPLLLAREKVPPQKISIPLLTVEPTIPQSIPVITNALLPTPRGSLQRNDANAVVAGLAVAHRRGQLKSGSITWKKVQDAIKLLRLGLSREEAISKSRVDAQVFNQLIEWGRTPSATQEAL